MSAGPRLAGHREQGGSASAIDGRSWAWAAVRGPLRPLPTGLPPAVPALPSPLLFLAQPSTEAPPAAGQQPSRPHSLFLGVPWGDPGSPQGSRQVGRPAASSLLLASRDWAPPRPPSAPLGALLPRMGAEMR